MPYAKARPRHAQRVRNAIEGWCVLLALVAWFVSCYALVGAPVGVLFGIALGTWILARFPLAVMVILWESWKGDAKHGKLA